jgi:phage recombination protein Bet
MSQDLVVMALQDQSLMTAADVEILKRSKFKGFENHEMAYAIKMSGLLRLNPMLNQVHFVRRKNKDGSFAVTTQVGIDGFRLTAQRAGGYAGSDDAVFEYDEQKRPTKATTTVYRIVEGQRCSFTASARWDEYYNPVGGQWDRMGHVMLAKCSEALALRKAFPAELSAVNTPEEMDQADRPQKGQTIQDKIQDSAPALDAESRPVEEPSDEMPACSHCESLNVMASKYQAGSFYCRACKKPFTPGGV